MPNLVGVAGGLASVADTFVLGRSLGASCDGDVTTIDGFSGATGVGVDGFCSSMVTVFGFPSSSFSFLADSCDSSVDGRFCEGAVVFVTFGAGLVAFAVGFFFSTVLVTMLFFFAADCSSLVFDGLSFFA